MALYNVFLPGFLAPNSINPSLITGASTSTITTQPVQGTVFLGVNGATAAAAGAALQAALPGAGNQQGLMHIWTQANDNTA